MRQPVAEVLIVEDSGDQHQQTQLVVVDVHLPHHDDLRSLNIIISTISIKVSCQEHFHVNF